MINNGIVLWGFESIFLHSFMRALQHSCEVGSYAHFTDGKSKVREIKGVALIHSGRFRIWTQAHGLLPSGFAQKRKEMVGVKGA